MDEPKKTCSCCGCVPEGENYWHDLYEDRCWKCGELKVADVRADEMDRRHDEMVDREVMDSLNAEAS